MFEANSLSATYHLRDLERQCGPQISDYRADRATFNPRVVAPVLIVVCLAVSLGSAFLF